MPRKKAQALVPIFFIPILLCLCGVIVVSRMWQIDPNLPHIPTRGIMFKAFGVPVDYQRCAFHTGSDWGAVLGAPIYAIEDGIVVYVGPLWLAGPGVGRGDHTIILDHGDYYTTYSHNSVALVAPGEQVQRGQVIAEIGDEGYSGGPHLHLEKVIKAISPFTGNWQEPFIGCDGYVDPSDQWSWW
jgi:murein DD-endopeptidase MepM/ murein hydrolase activator NlpD